MKTAISEFERKEAKLKEEIQALKATASSDSSNMADLEKDKAALTAAKVTLTADISSMKDPAVVISQEVNELRGRNGIAALLSKNFAAKWSRLHGVRVLGRALGVSQPLDPLFF